MTSLDLTPINLPTAALNGPAEVGDVPVWNGSGYDFLNTVYDIRTYGADPDATDNVAAIQEAIDAITAAGRGTLYVPDGVFDLVAAHSVAGVSWHLSVPADNIRITGPGTLRTSANGVHIFSIGGQLKAGENWHLNHYVDWGAGGPTVYAMAAATRGATQIQLTTAAQAANFAPGDKVFIRTGQVFDNPNQLNTEPDAEINEVLSADSGTGVITLKYPLTKDYAQEYFLSGTWGRTTTSVTANAAIFGASKVTDRTSENIQIDSITLEHTDPSDDFNAFITGAGIDGLTIQNVKAYGAALMNMGNYRQGLIVGNVNHFDRGDSYGLTTATGTSDVLFADNELTNAGGVVQIHMHEGTARTIVRNNRLFSKVGVADFIPLDVRARAYDIRIEGNLVVNTGTTLGCYVDDLCPGGGIISGNIFVGTLESSIAIASPNWTLGLNNVKSSRANGITAVGLYDQSVGVVERLNNTVTPSRTTASLGTLPAMSFVTAIHYWVEEAFNSSGTDTISVGFSGTEAGIAPATDVSSAGRVTPNLTPNYGFNRQDRDLNAYYVAGGSAPTTGKAIVVVEYVRVRDAYS